MTDNNILLEKQGSTAYLIINRPEKKNAICQSMWQHIADYVDIIEKDSDIRVVVVKGQTGVFCAGADISEFKSLANSPEKLSQNNAIVQIAQEKLEELSRPTIAMIDGPCVGGGMGIALCCDFRIASERSVFGITPAKLGLLYSKRDTRRLLAQVGPGNAKDILYTGRILPSNEAKSMNLVNQIVALDELESTVNAWISKLEINSQYSIRGCKTVFAHLGGYQDLSDEDFQKMYDDAFSKEDCIEGVAAFKEKRSPKFTWG